MFTITDYTKESNHLEMVEISVVDSHTSSLLIAKNKK